MSEKKQKYRFLDIYLPPSSNRTLILLTGARQTGKTTLAKQKYPALQYINLDSPENREMVRDVSSSSWARDVGNAILDEAQKEPALFEKVKYSFDEGGISFSLLSGSSQILLLKKIRESLAGRVSLYELWPLTMAELLWDADAKNVTLPLVARIFSDKSLDSIFHDVPGSLPDKADSPIRDAENYMLRWGGMPALLPLSEEERWKWLRDYSYTYLERDVSDLARLSDLGPFRKFQRLSALRSGRLLNYSEIARDASISVDTARRYLEYLRISYQAILLPPYQKNITSSVVKTPKIYWVDIGILRQLIGLRGAHTGEIYETMVISELIKWMRTSQDFGELFFYRTRSGLELDGILQTEGGVIGIEIKSRRELVKKDITAMKEVAAGLGTAWRGGLLIYLGNKIFKIAEPSIWAVPSRRLFAA